jgi:Glu-tRNA(Gln) amidotransferase subunit E-like FAD-binding protein
MTNKVTWATAVKAYGKGRVKKNTPEYEECRKLFEKMKQEAKEVKQEVVEKKEVKQEKKEEIKKIVDEIHNELSNEKKPNHRKSATELLLLLKMLKQKKDNK